MRRLLLCFLYALFAAQAADAIDINGYLRKAALENQSTDPSTTLTGRVYWNTTVQSPKVYNGTSWVTLGSGAAVSPTAQSYGPSAVTPVGTAGFPQLGHVLDTKDFTAPASNQYAFWNLSSTSTTADGGSQGISLTPNGTPTYVTANVIGATGGSAVATLNGATQYYSSTNAFFNPGNGKGWAFGAWINPTSWSGTFGVMSQQNSTSDRAFGASGGGSQINCAATNTAASWDASVGASTSGLSGWHHFACVYSFSAGTLSMYIDGKLAAVPAALANTRATTTTQNFTLGNYFAGTFFSGGMEDAFFISGYSATADDIRKLAARRFDHNKGIATNSQLWNANWGRSDSNVGVQLDASWLVSKSINSLWADFSGVATGAFVDLELQNTGLVGTQLFPNSTYDSGLLSSTPATTIAHNLGSRPASIVYEYETTTGHFTPLTGSNFCEADSTSLYCDWTGLSVSASNRLEIIAGGVPLLSAVPLADATTNGIINSNGAQTIGGAKTFSGAVTTNSSVTAAGRVTAGNSKVYAYASTNQTVSANSGPGIVFGSTVFDVNSEFSSNKFTPVSPGYYLVSMTVDYTCASASFLCVIKILKNNSELVCAGVQSGQTGESIVSCSAVVFLNGTTDYVITAFLNNNTSSTASIFGGAQSVTATKFYAAQIP